MKRVLIVEDDEDVRSALAALLEGEGYSVVEAAHGAEALTQLRSRDEICLIVLDLWMRFAETVDVIQIKALPRLS